MVFHLRFSTRETKDLPVSKRANESFLAKGDIYAYRVSGTAASLTFSCVCHMALPSSPLLKPWGSKSDPWRSEITCFTPGDSKPTQWQVFQVTDHDLQVGTHDPECI